MKKFLAVLLTAAAIFSTAQVVEPVTAYAQDVWVANKGNSQFYVVTETFQKYREHFSVIVKIVTPNARADEFNDAYKYDFLLGDANTWLYKTNQTGQYRVVGSDFVAQRVLNYCLENLY